MDESREFIDREKVENLIDRLQDYSQHAHRTNSYTLGEALSDAACTIRSLVNIIDQISGGT